MTQLDGRNAGTIRDGTGGEARGPGAVPAVSAEGRLRVIVLCEDGTASLDGESFPIPEGQNPRDALLAEIRRVAVTDGHAVPIDAHDVDGVWQLMVGADGEVTERAPYSKNHQSLGYTSADRATAAHPGRDTGATRRHDRPHRPGARCRGRRSRAARPGSPPQGHAGRGTYRSDVPTGRSAPVSRPAVQLRGQLIPIDAEIGRSPVDPEELLVPLDTGPRSWSRPKRADGH